MTTTSAPTSGPAPDSQAAVTFRPAPTAPSAARRSRRGRAAALAAAVCLLAAGCAQIPQSSAVRSDPAQDDRVAASEAPQFRPPGPPVDAAPEQIVRGFLTAGTGPQDDYAVARQYLAGQAARDWDPSVRTLVYASDPTVTRGEDGVYQVQVEVESEVDEDGVRTPAGVGTTRALEFTVQTVGGQPRITDAEDGVLLSRTQFAQLYAPQQLVFFDQTGRYAIPDVRWFVNRSGRAAAVVSALLRGPAPYLVGAVNTAFPAGGAALTGPTVPISPEGVARVDLTAGSVEGVGPAKRRRMQEQLRMTLTGLYGVDEVSVTAGGAPLAADLGEPVPTPVEEDLEPGSVQVGVDAGTGGLVLVQDMAVTPMEGLPPLDGPSPVDPALDRDRTAVAFLDPGRTTLSAASTEGWRRRLLTGVDLTGPSVDPQGWVWTATQEAGPRIRAVPLAGPDDLGERTIAAPWLESDERIRELRIGPGGARAALIVDDGERRTVRVAGVVRGSDGVPTALTEPVALTSQSDPEDVQWADEVTLVATTLSTTPEEIVRPELLSLDGTARQLNPLKGVLGLSAGAPGLLYAETADGLSLLVGSSWRAQDLSVAVRDPAFPG